MADYENAYRALMQKRQEELAATGGPSEQQYADVAGQQQLGTLLNSLFKSQALMGSVAGKPTEETGFDMASFANNNQDALKGQALRAAEKEARAEKNFQAGRQNTNDLMGSEKFGADMKSDQQKFDFNEASNPLKLQGMQQDVDFTGQANPLKLQGMSLNNQGAQQDLAMNPLKRQMLEAQLTQTNAKTQHLLNPSLEQSKEEKNIQVAQRMLLKAKELETSDPVMAKMYQEKAMEMTRRTPTDGEKTLDRESGKSISDWMDKGRSTTMTNLAKVENGIKLLEDGLASTGRVVGRMPDFLQKEASINARDSIRSAVQASLRETLGAQFTEKEGERIMNFAYNPAVSEADNIRKAKLIQAELQRITKAKDEKMKYFLSNGGTLRGMDLAKFQQDEGAALLAIVNGNSQPTTTTASAASSKPKTVVQGGHTYTLNESTGEYE